MSKLFIANLTKQHFDFLYRVPENTKLLSESIGAGKQIALSGEFTRDVIDLIVEQHLEYGLRAASEVYSNANKDIKVPLAYSIDKPVDIDKLLHGITANDDFAQSVANEAQINSTAATIDALGDAKSVVIDTFAETVENGVKTSKKVSSMGKK